MVEAVGDDVSAVQVGDHVVACLSGFCGTCPQCLSGHPNVCTGGIVTRPETGTPRLSQEGGLVRAFAGIGSYAEKMLLHENSVVRIDPDIPLDRAALVGCGVLTGVGAALRSSGMRGRADRGRIRLRRRRACRSSRARASAARGRSSRSTSSIPSWRWPSGVGATHTVNSRPRTTR